MGANFFEITVATQKTQQETYRDLCDNARREYGANPYNGTISTTLSCETYHIEGKQTQAKLKKLKHDFIYSLDKGDCVAVEITVPSIVKQEKEWAGLKGKRNVKVYRLFGWAAE